MKKKCITCKKNVIDTSKWLPDTCPKCFYKVKENKNKGCRGRRIQVEPEKSGILGNDELIQRGKVIGAGPEAVCNVGDTIIFSTDGLEVFTDSEGVRSYFILDVDTFVWKIL